MVCILEKLKLNKDFNQHWNLPKTLKEVSWILLLKENSAFCLLLPLQARLCVIGRAMSR